MATDICLQQIADTIRQSLRHQTDLLARFGGEEFAVILPNTPVDSAVHLAEDIRSKVAGLKIEHSQSSVSQYLTISLGVAIIIPNYIDSPTKLIDAANAALFLAKKRA